MAICCGCSHVVVVVWVTTRRMRRTLRGSARAMWRLARGATVTSLECLTYCGVPVLGASATCTAPPPISAPPAATVASFARAVRTDMVFSLVPVAGELRNRNSAILAPQLRNAESAVYDNRVNRFRRVIRVDSAPVEGSGR